MKANIRLITRIDSAGNAVVYGGNCIGFESTPGSNYGNITSCLNGNRKQSAGYKWEDCSEEYIDLFFEEMDKVDTNETEES